VCGVVPLAALHWAIFSSLTIVFKVVLASGKYTEGGQARKGLFRMERAGFLSPI